MSNIAVETLIEQSDGHILTREWEEVGTFTGTGGVIHVRAIRLSLDDGRTAKAVELEIDSSSDDRGAKTWIDSGAALDSFQTAIRYLVAFQPKNTKTPTSWQVDYRRGEVKIALFNERPEPSAVALANGIPGPEKIRVSVEIFAAGVHRDDDYGAVPVVIHRQAFLPEDDIGALVYAVEKARTFLDPSLVVAPPSP